MMDTYGFKKEDLLTFSKRANDAGRFEVAKVYERAAKEIEEGKEVFPTLVFKKVAEAWSCMIDPIMISAKEFEVGHICDVTNPDNCKEESEK